MSITSLQQNMAIAGDAKLEALYTQFDQLINELDKKSISTEVISDINKEVEETNASSLTGNELKRLLKKKQSAIVTLVEKKHKIVPKDFYRQFWMILGMSAIGLPFGVGLGVALGSMAYLGLGIPIGMGIGMVMGSAMDKKALKEGRQLDVEIKY
jgi:hypothetical protein